MHELSEQVNAVKREFQIDLPIVSGGNSANYEWYNSVFDTGRVNNLRIGEP